MTEPQTVPFSTEGVRGILDPAPDEVANQYDPTKAGESPYDNPEFQQELKAGIEAQIEGWHKDWSIRISALMEALDLSRLEAMTYLLLMQMGSLRGLASGFQHMWNDDPAQKRRAMQDKLLEEQLKRAGFEVSDEQPPALSPAEAVEGAARGWKIR